MISFLSLKKKKKKIKEGVSRAQILSKIRKTNGVKSVVKQLLIRKDQLSSLDSFEETDQPVDATRMFKKLPKVIQPDPIADKGFSDPSVNDHDHMQEPNAHIEELHPSSLSFDKSDMIAEDTEKNIFPSSANSWTAGRYLDPAFSIS